MNWEEKYIDYLEGNLAEGERIELENHLLNHPEAQQEFIAIKSLFQNLTKIPSAKPSEQMNVNFYEMLRQEKAKTNLYSKWQEKLNQFWASIFQTKSLIRLTYSVLLLVIGFGIGFWLNQNLVKNSVTNANIKKDDIQKITKELQEVKEMMMLTMLKEKSASERLKAVSLTSELPKVDDKIVEALLKTLNNDENVNVRLVTVETLVEFATNPKVREGLIKSITKQDSPLVQIALVDAMTALQEKKSVKELQKLLEKRDLNDAVKGKVEESIKVLL